MLKFFFLLVSSLILGSCENKEDNKLLGQIIGSVTGDGFEFYLQGNIMKYLCRYPYKNGVEDLEKARWYLNKLIEIKKGE